MSKVSVKLNSIDKVKEFVEIVSKFSASMDLSHGRYVVDAKSIMGVFSLDLSNELCLSISADSETETEAIINAVKKFTV